MSLPAHLFLCALLGGSAYAEPPSGYVAAVTAKCATVSLGSTDGVLVGTKLTVTRGGTTVGTLLIQSVRPHTATGRWQGDGLLRVGDAVAIAGRPPSGSPSTGRPTGGPAAPVVRRGGAAPANPVAEAVRPLVCYVAQVSGRSVYLSVGARDGVRIGDTFVIRRGGTSAGRVRVVEVGDRTARAERLGAVGPLQVGEELRAPPGRTVPARRNHVHRNPSPLVETTHPPPPRSLSGLPRTYTVPRNDRTYDLLGALAARGLIRKYPARVFFDDRVFRHRPDDDLVLTRRQIAELIGEALKNAGEVDRLDTATALVLKRLVEKYQDDLGRLGLNADHALGQLQLVQANRLPWAVDGYFRTRHTPAHPGAIGSPAIPDGMALDLRGNLWADWRNKVRFTGAVESAWESDGWHTQLSRAVLAADWKWLTVELGKDRFWWGPGHYGSLILSDFGRPFEYLRTRMRAGDLSYEGFVTTGLHGRRDASFYGHKLELAYSPELRFGVAETMVASGSQPSLSYSLAALAPLLPFAVIDNLRTTSHNPVASVYAEASLAKGYQAYVEFLVDDFVVKARETSRNRTGVLFGSYWHDADEPDRLNLRLEYARLDHGVYVPTDASERYFDLGTPLGYPLSPSETQGIETEDYRLELQYKPVTRLTLGFGYEWTNFGREQPVRSKQTTLRLRAAYDLSDELSAAVRFRRAVIQNAGFVPGVQVTDRYAEAELFQAF